MKKCIIDKKILSLKKEIYMYILVFFLIGALIGYYNIFNEKMDKIISIITNISLVVLLGTMGMKIGSNERIITNLGMIGIKAGILSVVTIIGSLISLLIFAKISGLNNFGNNQGGSTSKKNKSKKKVFDFTSYLMIFSVIFGTILGLMISDIASNLMDKIVMYSLIALLFGIGIDTGSKKTIFKKLKKLGYKIIFIPVFVAIGSIFGAIFASFFIGLTIQEAAAVGAGFGWYSLSGVILTRVHSVSLGSMAFLSNIFRELLTVIILPFVVKYFGNLAAIAPGGATTMDITLPVIKETAGEELVIPAFINGVILSALVPILVPFLINL